MAWSGFGSVVHAVMRIGLGGFLLMVCCQLAVDGVLGLAWHAAFPEIGYLRLLGARMVRDAAATCLPFSQLGGIVIGIRTTCSGHGLHGREARQVDLPEAACANLVDITTEVMGQVAFVLLGVAFLVAHQRNSPFVMPVIIGAVFLIVGTAGFIWTQRHGGSIFRRFGGCSPAVWRLSGMTACSMARMICRNGWKQYGAVLAVSALLPPTIWWGGWGVPPCCG